MTSRSKFDVDLTKIVKRTKERSAYLVGEGLEIGVFSTFDDAANYLTRSEIYHFLRLPPCMSIESALVTKEYRDKIREVIDYLDRD